MFSFVAKEPFLNAIQENLDKLAFVRRCQHQVPRQPKLIVSPKKIRIKHVSI